MRFRWLVLIAFGLVGCHSLAAPVPDEVPPAPVAERTPAPGPTPGQHPASAPQKTTSSTDQKDADSPTPADDTLTLAAEGLGRGDRSAAAAYLGSYVREHPDQIMFRAQLAELLLKIGRPSDARGQFERFVADAQGATGPANAHLVHCHTRLMEIGQQTDDRFAEVFHRGVGLLLLVQKNADVDEELGEEILCRAIRALMEAAEMRPTDPRVQLYLADAHDRAGNRRAADVARATARNLAVPGSLTPAECGRLALGERVVK